MLTDKIKRKIKISLRKILVVALVTTLLSTGVAFARDIDYGDEEVKIFVTPGEPTSIQFPGPVAGGYRKKVSALSVEPRDRDLIVFAGEQLPENGEAIIVRLKDGRSYSVRIARAAADGKRDDFIKIKDTRQSVIDDSEEDEPAYKEKNFEYAPPSRISGLMREMVLVAEFGKAKIPGYRKTTDYRGQALLDDGTLRATIDQVFIGHNLWGYVIDAENKLGTAQKINPAAFRIDGARAVSARYWELAPIPMTIEHQVSGKHRTKVYIVARARR
jgi:hypothetical protein